MHRAGASVIPAPDMEERRGSEGAEAAEVSLLSIRTTPTHPAVTKADWADGGCPKDESGSIERAAGSDQGSPSRSGSSGSNGGSGLPPLPPVQRPTRPERPPHLTAHLHGEGRPSPVAISPAQRQAARIFGGRRGGALFDPPFLQSPSQVHEAHINGHRHGTSFSATPSGTSRTAVRSYAQPATTTVPSPSTHERIRLPPSEAMEKQTSLTTDMDDEQMAIIYGYHAPNAQKLDAVKIGAMQRKETIQNLVSKLQEVNEHQPLKGGTGGTKKLRVAAKALIVQSRLKKRNSISRGMDFWQSRDLGKKGQGTSVPWYKKAVSHSNIYVNILHFAVIVLSMFDIAIMATESPIFIIWRRHGGNLREVSPGTHFVAYALKGRSATEVTNTEYISKAAPNLKMIFGLISDVANIANVLLRFRLVQNHHSAAQDPTEIGLKYLKSWFLVDLFGALPFYWIFVPIPWVRVNRLVNLWRMKQDMYEIKVLAGIYVNMQVIRVVSFVAFMSLWVHVLACFTTMIMYSLEETSATVWMAIYDDNFMENFRLVYLRSTLWAWSQITNGQGDMSPQEETQMIWTLMNQFVGSFVYMLILGKVVTILQNFDLGSAEFNLQRDMVSTFLRIRDVPPALRRRVHIYFDALWDKKRGMDEETVIKSLPSFLRHDLVWSINRNFLEKVPMFIGADANCLMVMNKYLVHEVITREEFLVRTGDWESSLFFVTSGELRVWGANGEVVAELYEGSVVGEVGIILQIAAVSDVQATTTCDLLSLSRDDYASLIQVFPAFEEKLIKRAERLYGKDWERWKEEAALLWSGVDLDGPLNAPREQSDFAPLQRKSTFKAVEGGLSPFVMGDVTKVRRPSNASPGRSFASPGRSCSSQGRESSGRNSARLSQGLDSDTKKQIAKLSEVQDDVKTRMSVMEAKVDMILNVLVHEADPSGGPSQPPRPPSAASCSSERRALPLSPPLPSSPSAKVKSLPTGFVATSKLDALPPERVRSLPGTVRGDYESDSGCSSPGVDEQLGFRADAGETSQGTDTRMSLISEGMDGPIPGRVSEARPRRRSAPVAAFASPTVPEHRRQSLSATPDLPLARCAQSRKAKRPPALQFESTEPFIGPEVEAWQDGGGGAAAGGADTLSPGSWSRLPTASTAITHVMSTEASAEELGVGGDLQISTDSEDQQGGICL